MSAIVCSAGLSPVAAQTSGSAPAAPASAPGTPPVSARSSGKPAGEASQPSKRKPFAAPQAKPARKPTRTSSRPRRNSPRLRRMRQAFVASATLKPMARQLLQDRTPQAYLGVESFARKHSAEDAGSLAWLAVGHARFFARDYATALDPLNRAKPHRVCP